MNHFMVATTSAEVTCPATTARFLPVNMPFGEPTRLKLAVDASNQVAHSTCGIADKTMAGREFSVCRNP